MPRKPSGSPPPPRPQGERELVVIAKPEAGLRARATGLQSTTNLDVAPLTKVLQASKARLIPLFGPTEEHAAPKAAAGVDGGAPMVQLQRYYRVEAADEQLDALARSLRALPMVEAAYVKPPAEPAYEVLNTMQPQVVDAPPTTPDFTTRQGFLGAAPGGVDALHAWTLPGGRGAGVRVIDIEGAWRFTHEDLTQSQGGVVGGSQLPDPIWRNHGTAVIGVIGGDTNGQGVTGISPDAFVRAISIFGGLGSGGAIRRAADLLGAGDVILIELHRPGPLATGVGQEGFIAIEWWPDDYDAIQYATSRGVIVVEAAGNGAQDLDAPAYDVPQPGFPPGWSNPFRRGARDSGAILAGAGAPPRGTHGHDHGPDRSRLDFSNFGAAVDAQGWGREVTTTGYGDLQGGGNEDLWYTDGFSGTSSASPIVVGALSCLQGVRRAQSTALMTPMEARALLRSTGSPQQDAPGRPASQRIGNRPDLRQLLATQVQTVPLHRYWNAGAGDHFYTTNWNELGGGNHGWGYEGIQGHVYPTARSGTVPLYRYWNAGIGDHFYTTNWGELGTGAYGWGYEGIQCYVEPMARSGVPLTEGEAARASGPAMSGFEAGSGMRVMPGLEATGAVPASFQMTGKGATAPASFSTGRMAGKETLEIEGKGASSQDVTLTLRIGRG
ncbi:S8 family serine peptidase [Corallococcus sp. CA031C]|uniref:S8 family serine peptidase n=1 Tax=Corallococcus sp. CA031C TaxID=2316725 RepID=UPI000EA2C884|nr:S8 family serine peptidase [Corallococcus sp. CA031C]RKH22025.1 serine protease [Corallococcus sp. CA031C]